jgi:uncharacterized protein (UPF0332 family)
LEAEGALAPDETKTHSSVLRLFSEVFVLSGRATRDLGRGLNLVQSMRAKADYGRTMTSEESARKALETMVMMLEFANEYLEPRKEQDS